jgi:hypothetical protein
MEPLDLPVYDVKALDATAEGPPVATYRDPGPAEEASEEKITFHRYPGAEVYALHTCDYYGGGSATCSEILCATKAGLTATGYPVPSIEDYFARVKFDSERGFCKIVIMRHRYALAEPENVVGASDVWDIS